MDFGKFFSHSLTLLFKKIRNTQMSNISFSTKYLNIRKVPWGLGEFLMCTPLLQTTDYNEKLHNPQNVLTSLAVKNTQEPGECFSCITFHRLCVPRVCPNPFNPPPWSRITRSPPGDQTQISVSSCSVHQTPPTNIWATEWSASQFKNYFRQLWGLHRINRHRDLWNRIYYTSNHMFGLNVQMFLYWNIV